MICWDNDGPVLVATVREEAWRMLAAIGSRDEVPAEMFWDQLHMRARPSIRELVESGATTGFGGGTGACRRRRSLRTSAAAFLAERGRPASIDELVGFHDQRMRKRRADPVKQGPCCRRRSWSRSGSSHRPKQPAGGLLCRGSGCAHAPRVGSCARRDPVPVCGCVVAHRTGCPCVRLRELADKPTAARSLGTRLGWSEATVLRELHTVKGIARQVLGERGFSESVAG